VEFLVLVVRPCRNRMKDRDIHARWVSKGSLMIPTLRTRSLYHPMILWTERHVPVRLNRDLRMGRVVRHKRSCAFVAWKQVGSWAMKGSNHFQTLLMVPPLAHWGCAGERTTALRRQFFAIVGRMRAMTVFVHVHCQAVRMLPIPRRLLR
jgi:hypothetical protein